VETRSHWLMVALVVSLLIAAAIGFAVWLMQPRDVEGATYEIRFERSVGGLREGSGVNLLGVPVGRVTEVRLEPNNPGVVTVRFALTRDVPLRQGVTASIERSLLDGSATISLEGGDNRAPALAARPGQPFPIVPVKSGGLLGGDLDPANVIARVSSGAESLSNKLDPADQRQIEQRLAELARRSRSWEGEADRVVGQIAQPGKIEAFGRAVARAGDDAERLRRQIESSRGGIRGSLARPLDDAERTAESLGQAMTQARPRIRQLEENAGEMIDTVRSLREPVRQVGDAAQKIDQEGLRSSELPDHRPSAGSKTAVEPYEQRDHRRRE
jgi:phospholipid/cholesterol/gamma-HCH transport system substrate-binding protein